MFHQRQHDEHDEIQWNWRKVAAAALEPTAAAPQLRKNNLPQLLRQRNMALVKQLSPKAMG
jgi:hypothetical protein